MSIKKIRNIGQLNRYIEKAVKSGNILWIMAESRDARRVFRKCKHFKLIELICFFYNTKNEKLCLLKQYRPYGKIKIFERSRFQEQIQWKEMDEDTQKENVVLIRNSRRLEDCLRHMEIHSNDIEMNLDVLLCTEELDPPFSDSVTPI